MSGPRFTRHILDPLPARHQGLSDDDCLLLAWLCRYYARFIGPREGITPDSLAQYERLARLLSGTDPATDGATAPIRPTSHSASPAAGTSAAGDVGTNANTAAGMHDDPQGMRAALWQAAAGWCINDLVVELRSAHGGDNWLTLHLALGDGTAKRDRTVVLGFNEMDLWIERIRNGNIPGERSAAAGDVDTLLRGARMVLEEHAALHSEAGEWMCDCPICELVRPVVEHADADRLPRIIPRSPLAPDHPGRGLAACGHDVRLQLDGRCIICDQQPAPECAGLDGGTMTWLDLEGGSDGC